MRFSQAASRSASSDGRPRKRTWLFAGGVIIAGHAALLMTLMAVQPHPAPEPAPFESMVTAIVIDPPAPPPAPPPPVEQPEPVEQPSKPAASPAPAAPAPSAAAKRPSLGRPAIRARIVVATPPPDVEPLPVAGVAAGEPSVILGAGDLVGAVVAGSGGSGGGGGGGDGSGTAGGRCDMVRRLQEALRDDPDIRTAVTRAHGSLGSAGKAILVWNGEWLKSPGQEGKGLAGVRQAIALEIAFAPAACRSQPMHGLALISFSDRPGGPQLALGTGAWRWSDLLAARRGG